MLKIQTTRLNIRIASDEEMVALIASESDADLKQAYSEMLALSMNHPESRLWYAVWFIERLNGERIGDLCFKGLNEDGSVEIGYGLLEPFWRQGYATEAVIAMVDWASRQSGVKQVEAESEESNIASQKVLLKSGFEPTGKMGEEGPRFVKRF